MVLFTTERLHIEIVQEQSWYADDPVTLALFPLLTPSVVAYLPPLLQRIDSPAALAQWLQTMQRQAHIMLVRSLAQNQYLGMVYLSQQGTVGHVGYWLAEPCWGQGFAQELLMGLIKWAKQQPDLHHLIGGVDEHNLASSHVLDKLGFQKTDTEAGVSHYVLDVG